MAQTDIQSVLQYKREIGIVSICRERGFNEYLSVSTVEEQATANTAKHKDNKDLTIYFNSDDNLLGFRRDETLLTIDTVIMYFTNFSILSDKGKPFL